MSGRLPSFLIIGVPKAGTTSLAAYLDEHPDVFISRKKEVHFFDRHYDLGLDWYRDHFAASDRAAAIGEATPTYIYNDAAIPRIAEALPDARLIVLLRNPVDRAYSNYWYQRSLGYERRGFAAAVDQEMQDPNVKPFRHLRRGRYLPYLERVCQYMPRGALHVALFEDLRDHPKEVFGDVCRFIEIDDATIPTVVGRVEKQTTLLRSDRLRASILKHKVWKRLPERFTYWIDSLNRVDKTYPAMEPALRARLVEWFREPNRALGEWLGRDLSVWDRETARR